jgi:hypothetical protein
MKAIKLKLFVIVTVSLICFGLINIFSYYLLKSQIGVSMYDIDRYRPIKSNYIKDESNGSFPHPYYGLSGVAWESYPNKISTEPVFGTVSSSPAKKPINVLVVGGSVAANMSNGGAGGEKHLFARILNESFGTNRFAVQNAAFGGGKQPQQYFRWVYLDLMGYEPDIVINVDGFNELALTLLDNKLLGIPAAFPRSHSRLIHASAADRSCSKLNNQLVNLYSGIPVFEYLSWVYIRRCNSRIEQSLLDKPWWSDSMGIDERTDYVNQSLNIWAESSKKLHENLSRKGIDYIHVLQPNQYLSGSKEFSEEEKSKFIGFKDYGDIIKSNYTKFSKAMLGNENFVDQRYLFKTIQETVYRDDCCHFNDKGMALIINNLIQENKAVFEKRLRK